ncbi:MAG: hypothetical protein ACR2RE_17130, partial [Geminicoccaceae bacterium]
MQNPISAFAPEQPSLDVIPANFATRRIRFPPDRVFDTRLHPLRRLVGFNPDSTRPLSNHPPTHFVEENESLRPATVNDCIFHQSLPTEDSNDDAGEASFAIKSAKRVGIKAHKRSTNNLDAHGRRLAINDPDRHLQSPTLGSASGQLPRPHCLHS